MIIIIEKLSRDESPRLMHHLRFYLMSLTGALMLLACTATPTATTAPAAPTEAPVATATEMATIEPSPTAMPFDLTSPAFEDGGVIPDRYSCKGEDISPELTWGDAPAGTQSLALVFDDPGAPWVHWVVYNLPASLHGLPEAIPDGATVLDTALHGANSWGTQDYRGPCPPAGSTHRYVFILYALDTTLNFDTPPGKRQLEAATDGHILAQIELAADFTR